MAPTKPSKGGSSGGKGKPGAKPSGKPGAPSKKHAGKAPEGISKRKSKSMQLAKPGGEQKKSKTGALKKKRRVYTEAELDIPKLNGIVPAGVVQPKGVKKGKVFVDDAESMMAIMSVVNAEKGDAVESKIMKARQWEEVRQAKKKEMDMRAKEKKEGFEERKLGLKKKKNKVKAENAESAEARGEEPKQRNSEKRLMGKKKRVTFG